MASVEYEKEGDASQLNEFIPDARGEVSENGIPLFVEASGPPGFSAKRNEKNFGKNKKGERNQANGENGPSSSDKVENPSAKVSEKGEDMTFSDEQDFVIGDIVWVRSKMQSWWPGQIVDPSHASSVAPKPNLKPSLLVKHFGSNYVIWCSLTQLKPFVNNFEHLSSQGKSRIFLSAVEKAVDEFGVRIKVQMSCPCVLKEGRGVKRETSFFQAQKSGIDKNILTQFEPLNFLYLVKNLAFDDFIPGTLGLASIRIRLSAFYHSLGHHQLPMQDLHEPTDDKGSAKRRINLRSKNDMGDKDCKIRDRNVEVGSEKWFKLRERRRSRYLSCPPMDLNQSAVISPVSGEYTANDVKVFKLGQSRRSLVGEPSLFPPKAKSNAKEFNKKRPQKLNQPNASIIAGDLNTSSADLLLKLRFAAVDCISSSEESDFDLVDRFFYGFRRWVFRDKYDPKMEVNHETGEKSNLEFESQEPVEDKPFASRSKSSITLKRKRIMKKETCLTPSVLYMNGTSGTSEIKSELKKRMKEAKLLDRIPGKNRPDIEKRKREGEQPKTKAWSNTIPDLNGSENAGESTSEEVFLEKSSTPNAGKPAKERKAKTKNSHINGGSLWTALVLTFPEGFLVPSKEDLIGMFRGFGPLNELETGGLSDPGRARVVFKNTSDAVEALRGIEKSNPFGPVLVTCRLHHFSLVPSPSGMEFCELKANNNKLKGSSNLTDVRKNLETMALILEKSGHNFLPDTRAKLESGVKGLLTKVSAMGGSSSSS